MSYSDNPRFAYTRYLVRRKIFTIFGGAFQIFDPNGQLVLYTKQKAFRIKEDLRLYADESMTTELLSIKARTAFDISTTYDIVDSASGQTIGALRRRGLKSIIRDEWMILDHAGNETGVIREESGSKALLRRFFPLAAIIMPQTYDIEVRNHRVAIFSQNFNPFVYKLDVDFSADHSQTFDRRIGLVAAVLLAAIEGKQEG